MGTDLHLVNDVGHTSEEAQSAPVPPDHRRYAPAPELIYERASISPLWLSEFALWFVNRREYYLQSAYATAGDYEKKAAAYYRVNASLKEENIASHLCGIHTLGLYTIDPDSNSCKWFCLDVDYDGSEKDLRAIEEEMKLDGLSPAYENSRRGGHLWLLCDEPLPAKDGRIYLYNLLDNLGFPIRGARGNREGVEVFPKQEILKEGQFGNGVRGPLGIHRKVKERFWFRDAEPNLASQFSYLRSLPRVTRSKLEDLIDGLTMPEDLLEKPFVAPPVFDDPTQKFNAFDIRRYMEIRGTITEAGVMVRCPSCAKAGKDRSGDNFHVSMKAGKLTPVVFCHAGCSFRDILDACGFRYERPERAFNTFQRKFK
jgi:hypothetical protein